MKILIQTKKNIWHLSWRGICRVDTIDFKAAEHVFEDLLKFQLAFKEGEVKLESEQAGAWRAHDDLRMPPADHSDMPEPM
jgi:hypothetical protein